MRAIPKISADFDEYPELRILADAALRRVVELMEIHDIVELRRIRKSGVFDHPYTKDVVTPMGIPTVPDNVKYARYNAGSALLDYLETVGINGVSLEVTEEDARAISALWVQDKSSTPSTPANPDPAQRGKSTVSDKQDSLDPTPVALEQDPTPVASEQDPTPVASGRDSVPVASEQDPSAYKEELKPTGTKNEPKDKNNGQAAN